MTLYGVDISSHQGIPDFAALKAAGYSFVVDKLTGGDQYVNPLFSAQRAAAASEAGLPFGVFHYDGEPTVHTGTPDAEAAWFLAHLPDPLPPDLFIALDAEERATRDPARYARWWDLVQARTTRKRLLYTFQTFITEIDAALWAPVADAALWYAYYPIDLSTLATRPMPTPPPPWDKRGATIWQYAGDATGIPGVAAPCDLNRFDGTLDDLLTLAAPPNPGFPGARPDGTGPVLNGVDWGGTDIATVEQVAVVVKNTKGVHYERVWRNYGLDPWRIV